MKPSSKNHQSMQAFKMQSKLCRFYSPWPQLKNRSKSFLSSLKMTTTAFTSKHWSVSISCQAPGNIKLCSGRWIRMLNRITGPKLMLNLSNISLLTISLVNWWNTLRWNTSYLSQTTKPTFFLRVQWALRQWSITFKKLYKTSRWRLQRNKFCIKSLISFVEAILHRRWMSVPSSQIKRRSKLTKF